MQMISFSVIIILAYYYSNPYISSEYKIPSILKFHTELMKRNTEILEQFSLKEVFS